MVAQIAERIVVFCLSSFFFIVGLFQLLFHVVRHGSKSLDVKPRPIPPQILNDEKYGKHNYIELKGRGIKIHYVEKGNPENPFLLCLHGFPEFWFSWRHQLEGLSSKFWVVAIDLRGYGDSTMPSKLSDYNHDAAVEDVREFILALGRNDCTLVGHDFGGVFSWKLVNNYPDLFQRHISINAPHSGILKHLILSTWDQFKKSWYIFFFNASWVPEKLLLMDDLVFINRVFLSAKFPEVYPDEVIEAYKYTFAKKGAMTAALNYYRTTFYKYKDLDFSDRKVTVPTQIIWGKEDTALIAENANLCAKHCEDVKLNFIDGAGHFVQEEQWKEVNRLIIEYCELFK